MGEDRDWNRLTKIKSYGDYDLTIDTEETDSDSEIQQVNLTLILNSLHGGQIRTEEERGSLDEEW